LITKYRYYEIANETFLEGAGIMKSLGVIPNDH